jgi:hypothetical protein
MIEAQIPEEVEAEATCPRGHRAVHSGHPEERSFVVPIGIQRLEVDDVDPPEGEGQRWGIEYHEDGLEQAAHVLGYHLICKVPVPPARTALAETWHELKLTIWSVLHWQPPMEDTRITYCDAEWWVAAPLDVVERWEVDLAAERPTDEAMDAAERTALDAPNEYGEYPCSACGGDAADCLDSMNRGGPRCCDLCGFNSTHERGVGGNDGSR